ncbi:hypothetical protein [Limosilactobacillus reuteri]|uniref:DUF3990 domain-containing protein n=2 Tax=Limosilactobacillus reuteri TaxID=1598 RepID=B3XL40_LIMR1|nr:hypothetical protein [Limosilactobacillus reuteri]EDX42247.1 hypothetical protein Lreu23DRAFT_3760 [Limosilactobacillus reuteri subsp. rodentium]MCC4476105.1 hypothetical protein [Limosilactobacillus reuteri]MRG90040.1 hypothetical protein [Limosilactobacillus reuteri]
MLYHSSTEKSINAILDNGIEEIKLPTIDSLTNGTAKGIGSYGVGFYGYLDDAKLSKYFFHHKLKNNKYRKAYTIRFNIRETKENVLNLVNDIDDMKFFNMFWSDEEVQDILKKLENEYSDGKYLKRLQGALIEYYILKLEDEQKMSHVKAVEGSSITRRDHNKEITIPDGIEYCIRDKSIVDSKSINFVEGV